MKDYDGPAHLTQEQLAAHHDWAAKIAEDSIEDIKAYHRNPQYERFAQANRLKTTRRPAALSVSR